MHQRVAATMTALSSSMLALGSTPSRIQSIIHPLSPLSEAESKDENIEYRWFRELGSDNDDLSFYDLYRSPCRGVIKASNDELLDQQDIETMSDDDEHKYIINYNNGGKSINKESDLYKAFHYYFDDMEYCSSTFFGGCRFLDLNSLENAIFEAENKQSFVNFTVVYDYEIHYIDRKHSVSAISNDASEDAPTADLSLNSRYVSIRGKPQEEHQQPSDPIPALEHLETVVVQHLGEVMGLGRLDCDVPPERASIGRPNQRNTHRHGFSYEDLGRMMAISSQPRDTLDPDYAECIVPVASAIGTVTDCVPVTGGVQIYLNTTDLDDDEKSLESLELSIQSGLQRLIRFGMQQDLYVDEDNDDEVMVKYVSFIGTRIVVDDDGEDPMISALNGGIASIEGNVESRTSKSSVASLVSVSIGIIGCLLIVW